MAGIRGFGAYLPARVVTNAELAARLGCDEDWMLAVSGIGERRYADESVTEMAVKAARDCLERHPAEVGMLMVTSGTAGRRFPGPAATVARELGLTASAIDLPMASAGALFGMALGARLAPVYGNVLVAAAERMSAAIGADKNTAILFGDIVDSVLHSDGAFTEDLRLEFGGPVHMNGRSVIMQAARKIPASIVEVLERNGKAADVDVFLMHRANQNLIDKVAKTLGVEHQQVWEHQCGIDADCGGGNKHGPE